MFSPSNTLLFVMPDLHPRNESHDMENRETVVRGISALPYHCFHSKDKGQALIITMVLRGETADLDFCSFLA
jgi:hypothetical protein